MARLIPALEVTVVMTMVISLSRRTISGEIDSKAQRAQTRHEDNQGIRVQGKMSTAYGLTRG